MSSVNFIRKKNGRQDFGLIVIWVGVQVSINIFLLELERPVLAEIC